MTPAREAFDEALARGSEHLKLGKLDQAQRAFRMALDADPGNARVLALLGLTYFRGSQFAEARPIYEELVEKAPTDASHRLNLGLVYLKLNEADRAITSLEASRALDPSQGRAVSYLGLAYARAGRYAEAYRSFLLAGQNELAIEIEVNLTAAERDGIHHQLHRTPHGPLPATDAAAVPPATPPVISRAPTPTPRTKPPSAPPAARTQGEVATDAAFAQHSHPEIVIETHASQPAVPMVPARSGASIVEPPPASPPPGTPLPLSMDSRDRVSDSMMFVLPKPEAAPAGRASSSMISRAIAVSAPAVSPSTAEVRTKTGGLAPRPLSELATDALLRPEDGDEPFELADTGALIIRIDDRVHMRLDGVHVTGGDLAYEPAMRRSRGQPSDERFDYGGTPLHTVSGSGYLIALPGTHMFTAVALDDDILYLREDLVFAFESTLRWESGNVPGMRGKLPVVQFRGDGALVIRTRLPLVRVKLPASGVVFIDADRLAGWIGRVIPRAVVPVSGGPLGAMCVECTGEGVVLVEPRADLPVATTVVAAVEPPTPLADERAKPPPPPPAPPAPVEFDPDLDMSSVNELMDPPGTAAAAEAAAAAAAAANSEPTDPDKALEQLGVQLGSSDEI